ncbi:MAG TPA: ABC transporter ATP-binding protein, partial [Ktedonobacterales bacterium]
MVEKTHTPEGPAIELSQVTFAYRDEPVLRDISLSIEAGECVGLLGPNGAGKSTLLRLIAGVLRPGAGSVRVGGQLVRSGTRRELSRQIAVVPQDFSVQFAYTVRQIVELGRTPHQGVLSWAGEADRAAVDSALAATHMVDLADRLMSDLSGGERQRVVLAMALAQQPAILLLDEPTAHLDIKHQMEILDLMRYLNATQGITVVATMHDLNLAARYFPRLVLIRKRILSDGPPSQVLTPVTLSAAYDAQVRVGILRGEEHLSVLPAPPAQDGSTPAAALPLPKAHVFAGGGSGELVLRALADADIPVSAGPLNVGDTDHALAQRLALAVIAEPPFASVSADGLASAREWIDRAGTLVVCPMPLGPGNL